MNIIPGFGEWANPIACIECIDVRNFIVGQFEVENINILVDAIFGDGFWHGNDTDLNLEMSNKTKNWYKKCGQIEWRQ